MGTSCSFLCSGKDWLQTHTSGGGGPAARSGPPVDALAVAGALALMRLLVAAGSHLECVQPFCEVILRCFVLLCC